MSIPATCDLEEQLSGLEHKYARALKVLTKVSEVVERYSDLDADLDFKCDQGSERREFSRGEYCGRTEFANKLFNLLMEKEEAC